MVQQEKHAVTCLHCALDLVLPALFFTVTPEDSCNFRIQVMRFGETTSLHDVREMEFSELQNVYEVYVLKHAHCLLDYVP